jgi:hypothetical protein
MATATSFFQERLTLRLDVLAGWPRFDPTDHYIFAYIEKLDRSKSTTIQARRDKDGRPWCDLAALCAAMPSLHLKPQAVAERIKKMAKAHLLDRSTKKVGVAGVGARQRVYVCPSQRYQDRLYALDQAAGRAAFREASRTFREASRTRANI